MAASIQRAEENDPETLKRRVADLEKQVRERPVKEVAKEIVPTVRVEVPVLEPGQLEKVRAIADGLFASAKDMHATGTELLVRIDRLLASPPPNETPRFARTGEESVTAEIHMPEPLAPSITAPPAKSYRKPEKKQEDKETARPENSSTAISGPQQTLLDALAEIRTVDRWIRTAREEQGDN